MIYSIYGEFGSGVTIPGYGFVMNNRAAQFKLDSKSPNVIAPGKRPFYTIIPGFVTKGGKPFIAYGLMSGDQQAQGHGGQAVAGKCDELGTEQVSVVADPKHRCGHRSLLDSHCPSAEQGSNMPHW